MKLVLQLASVSNIPYNSRREMARQSLLRRCVLSSLNADGRRGGKSGLHRAGCQITSGGREPTTSAAESIPPMTALAEQVRVKGCGKSAPRD